MKDSITVFVLLIAWIALFRWILPWFGVQTCMSGACARPRSESISTEKPGHQVDSRSSDDDEVLKSERVDHSAKRSADLQ